MDPHNWDEGYRAILRAIQEIGSTTEDLVAALAKYPDSADLPASCSLLHVALVCGGAEDLALLLRHGLDTERKDQDNYTPLQWALGKGHMEEVAELLMFGAAVDPRDRIWLPRGFENATLLWQAARVANQRRRELPDVLDLPAELQELVKIKRPS